MSENHIISEKKFHRELAIALFNQTWDLIDRENRTKEENDKMIHSAHASRYHWGEIGTALEIERGEWQISRVYSILKMKEPALYHAQRCLEICLEEDIGDFDIAFAYEAIARAYSISEEEERVLDYLKHAEKHGRKIKDNDDRDYFFSELKNISGK